MTFTDFLLIALLLVAALAICAPPSTGRKRVAMVAAGAAVLLGVVAFAGGRWQTAPAIVVAILLLIAGALRLARSGLRFAIGGVLALLGLVCAWPLWMMPAQSLPEPGGPYTIGTTVFELADPTRPMNPFHPGKETRRIQIRVWYPAQANTTAPTRMYFENDEAKIFGDGFGQQIGLPRHFWDQLKRVATHSHVDAPVAVPINAQQGRYPVVIFGHGYWSYPTQNTALMEHLASHGYVLFSVSHPGDSAGVHFADGTFVGVPPERPEQVVRDEMGQSALEKYFTSADPAERYRQIQLVPNQARNMSMLQSIEPWLADTRLLFDSLAKGGPGGLPSQIMAASDVQNVAVAGMSWGGSMAGTICLLDRRCKAAVNLDGMAWDWRLIDTALPVPLLLVQSDARRMFPDYKGPPRGRADFMYEKIAAAGDRPDIVRVMIDGTTHADMTDLTLFVRQPVRTKMVHLGSTPGERVAPAINSLVLAFLETNLRHQDVGFPDKPLQALPYVHRHDVSYVKQWYHTNGPGSVAPAAAPAAP